MSDTTTPPDPFPPDPADAPSYFDQVISDGEVHGPGDDIPDQ